MQKIDLLDEDKPINGQKYVCVIIRITGKYFKKKRNFLF